MTVDFYSGGELNQLLKNNQHHPTGAYAVVWMGKQNSFVKLDDHYFSDPVRANEVRKIVYQGLSNEGAEWELRPVEFSEEMLNAKAFLERSKRTRSRPQAQVIGDTYPNGQVLHELTKYYYPNGQALTDQATYYFPNGKARILQGRRYYPNGQQVSSQGQFFYPNGKRLTASSSVTDSIQYLTEGGRKLERAPVHVRYQDGDWTYSFKVERGRVVTDQFQVSWKSPDGTITLQINNHEVIYATIR